MGKKKVRSSTNNIPDALTASERRLQTSEIKTEEISSTSDSTETASSEKMYAFKDPSYANRSVPGSSKKPRVWKNLKQVIAAERLLPGVVTYSSLEAPPSLKPAKKYSDISGLPAKYTDPQTKLRYSNAEEYAKLRLLSPDQVNGYLILRRATLPVT
ncbi:INO80 complex subunit C-like [Ornithodoros turicata]|uniref:INO80 complex subunit C-like n=1 Tax=Ornithodoros turicata TaxID=34597 RepID=UPI003139FF03